MFAKLCKEITENSNFTLDNAFVVDFMPFAPENYSKIYIYGLYLARFNPDGKNSEQEIARALNVELSMIREAFSYWQSCGIVNILSTSPAQIEYLPINKHSLALRKFSKTKYKDFNDQLHAMFPKRNILPNEYNEYYSIMEAMHIEPSAMLAIIAYSIRQKGENVSYTYILAVARNLAHQGYITYDHVNEHLSEFDIYSKDLLCVLKALNVKKSPAIDDMHMFKKWTKMFGFSLETIIKVAKTIKKGGMEKLDTMLSRYYENHLFTFDDIQQFNDNRDSLYELTRQINRRIGVYYEQLDFIIETYISKWLGLGFSFDMLLAIAGYCFERNIRTLQGMNETVDKFYKKGLLSQDAIDDFVGEAVRADEQIRSVLEDAGLDRPVNSRDRDAFRTWTYTWKMPLDVIKFVAKLSLGKPSPVSYINRILSTYHSCGVFTLEQAKDFKIPSYDNNSQTTTSNQNGSIRTYSTEALNAIFDNLKYEDL